MIFHTLSNGPANESKFKGSRPQNIRRAILESAPLFPRQQRGHQRYAAFHHFVYRPRYYESEKAHLTHPQTEAQDVQPHINNRLRLFLYTRGSHACPESHVPTAAPLLGAGERAQQMTRRTSQKGRPGIIAPLSQVNQVNSPSLTRPTGIMLSGASSQARQGKMTRISVTGSAAADSWAIWQKRKRGLALNPTDT